MAGCVGYNGKGVPLQGFDELVDKLVSSRVPKNSDEEESIDQKEKKCKIMRVKKRREEKRREEKRREEKRRELKRIEEN